MASVTLLLTHFVTADVAWVKVAWKDLFVITRKELFNQNFAPVTATLFITQTRTLVSTVDQFSSAFHNARGWIALFRTQNEYSMPAWQLYLNCSVTATSVLAFLGTRVATIQDFVAVTIALVIEVKDYGVFETRHNLFMSTWKSLRAVDFARCTWTATYVFTSVPTGEKLLAFDLTCKIFRLNTALHCLFVTASRNNLHHRTCTETAIRIMATLLALMVIGATFPTHFGASARYMKFICRMTGPVASMTAVKTHSTEFFTTTKGKLLDVLPISYFVGIAVPLANQC